MMVIGQAPVLACCLAVLARGFPILVGWGSRDVAASSHRFDGHRFLLPGKSISVVLYLVGSGKDDASTRAEDTHMAENAYYFLREIASVQLGHALVTYRVDEVSGRRLARYSKEACLNLQADPEVAKEQMEDLQKELHKHILLLGPVADTDSWYVRRWTDIDQAVGVVGY